MLYPSGIDQNEMFIDVHGSSGLLYSSSALNFPCSMLIVSLCSVTTMTCLLIGWYPSLNSTEFMDSLLHKYQEQVLGRRHKARFRPGANSRATLAAGARVVPED